MKITEFVYHRPDSLEQALELLAEWGDEAKVLAGGQSLVPLMAMRLSRPGHIVDIGRLPELRSLTTADGEIRVGAMVRHSELEAFAAVSTVAPLVAAAMPHIGHRAIRNRGTACGSLAHADPAAELPAVALTLGSTFVVRSAHRERALPADEFFTGYLTTALEPDELLVEWRLPAQSATAGWSVHEFSRRHGDFALLGCAATLGCDPEGRITAAALSFFGAGSTPVRVCEAEELLFGEKPGPDLFAEAGHAVESSLDPPGDLHGTAAYRRHLGSVLTMRSLAEAADRTRKTT